MRRWLSYLIIALILFGVVHYYVLSKLTVPSMDWLLDTNNTRKVVVVPQEQVPKEIVALRKRDQLRPLTDAESGSPARDLPNGTYGYAACDAQAVNARRTDNAGLEIHKHADGIVYYVGYASEDHVEKYLTRQKNFHILVSREPRGKASVVFEIPVDFVSKCTSRSGDDGAMFDLFVTTIPELHTFQRTGTGRVLTHSMMAVAAFLTGLDDGFIDPTLDPLHGFYSHRLDALADQPLKILLDRRPGCVAFQQEQQRIDLDLHQGEGCGNGGDGLLVHGDSSLSFKAAG
jgi:hypothetical protein